MQATTLKGKLMYTGSGYIRMDQPYVPRSWPLVQNDGLEIDVRPLILDCIQAMDGKRARHKETVDGYSITLDEDELETLRWNNGYPCLISKTGASNITSYLDMGLMMVAARMVKIRLDDSGLSVKADPAESVFAVRPQPDNHHCIISASEADKVCKVNDPGGCCIFSRKKEDGLFYCDKFTIVPARDILDAYAEKRMPSKYSFIGNCAYVVPEKVSA